MNIPIAALVVLAGFFAVDCAVGSPAPDSVIPIEVRQFRPTPEFQNVEWELPPVPNNQLLATGDFNGDGRTDIVFLRHHDPFADVWLSQPPRRFVVERWRIDLDPNQWLGLKAGDFDNDGASDLFSCLVDPRTPVFWLARPAEHRFEPRAFTIERPLPSRGEHIIAEHSLGLRPDRIFEISVDADGPHRSAEALALTEGGLSLSREKYFFDPGINFIGFESTVRGRPPAPVSDNAPYYRLGDPPVRWSQIPETMEIRANLFGDFNGDERVDLMLFGNDLFGTWAILAHTPNGIAVPLHHAPRLAGPEVFPKPGDFNGDGLTDVLLYESLGRAVILESVPGPPMAAEIVLESGERLRTDPFGRIEMPFDRSRGTALSVASRGTLDSVSRTIRGGIQRGQTVVLHVPSSDPGVSGEVGSNVSWEIPARGPFVCIGANPYDTPEEGQDAWGRTPLACPDNFAIVEFEDGFAGPGLCCQLPERDILTVDHQWTSEPACPEQSIVTGISFHPVGDKTARQRPIRIRCTGIRADRYVLAVPEPGRYWGIGTAGPSSAAFGTNQSAMPLALREAIGRSDYAHWDFDGCIGAPAGALLVSRPGRRCEQSRFATLLRRGAGAPQPVQMFPDCREPPNIYNPLAGCPISNDRQAK